MAFLERIAKENTPVEPPVKTGSGFLGRLSTPTTSNVGGTNQPLTAPLVDNFKPNAMSTPAIAPEGTPDLNPIKLFKPRTEPVEIRRPFETTPVKTKAPPIVTGFASFGNSIVEMIPKGLATLYGETKYKTTGKETVDIGIDARRLGFKEKEYTTAVKEIADRVTAGESPWGASIGVTSEKALDVIVVGQVLKSIANVSMQVLKKGGQNASIEAWNVLGKPQTMEEAKLAFRKKAFEFHPDMGGSQEQFSLVNNAFKVLEKQGIPTATTRAIDTAGRMAEVATRETSLGKGFFSRIVKPDLTPRPSGSEVTKITGLLPGYEAYKPNMQAGFVDFSGNAKRGKAVGFSKEVQPLADEVTKYSNADEFARAVTDKTSVVGAVAFGNSAKKIPVEIQKLHDAFMEYVQKPEIQAMYQKGTTDTEVLKQFFNEVKSQDGLPVTQETVPQKGLFEPQNVPEKPVVSSDIQVPVTQDTPTSIPKQEVTETPVTTKAQVSETPYEFSIGGDEYSGKAIVKNGKTVGGIEVDYDTGGLPEIKGLIVEPKFRKQGVAKDVINNLLESEDEFYVRATPRAKKFWEKIGAEFTEYNEDASLYEGTIKKQITKPTPAIAEKPVKTPLRQSIEEKKKMEDYILPEDVSVSTEAKAVGAKRISPDRVPHQQLTPEKGMEALVEKAKNRAVANAKSWTKVADDIEALIKKYGTSMPMRTEANRAKYPDLTNDFYKYEGLKKYAIRPKDLADMRKQFVERAKNADWNATKEANVRAGVQKEYVDLIKADISKGYKYPEEVLKFDKSFSKAVDSRARYEKGLATSFSADDARIVFDEKDRLGAGMKRQDGKVLTESQKNEITKGVEDFQAVTGIDMKKLAENNRWVYVHLNGKNPFLMKATAGLYREGKDSVSISLGGVESFETIVDGKKVKETVNTTIAHEIGHALDYKVKNKMFDSTFLYERSRDFKPVEHSWRGDKYWRSNKEVTARMLEQYVAVQKGQTALFSREGYWTEEIYNTKIKPAVEDAINKHFSEYKVQATTPKPSKRIGLMDYHPTYTPRMNELIKQAQDNGDLFPYTKFTPEEQRIVDNALNSALKGMQETPKKKTLFTQKEKVTKIVKEKPSKEVDWSTASAKEITDDLFNNMLPRVNKRVFGTPEVKEVKKVEPKKPTVTKPKVEKPLPPALQEKKLFIENKREVLDNSPFKSKDNRLLVDREGRIRELGDIKNPDLIRKIEGRIADSGITDPAEFARGVEDYFAQKAELKRLEAELSTAVKEIRSEEMLGKIRDRLEKHQEKMVDFAEKYPKLASLITTMSEEATMGAKKGYKLGLEVGSKKTRDELVASFREQKFNVENIKNDIIQYATEKLPVSERGRLMTVVRDAKTRKNLIKAFTRIDRKVDELAIKTSINELKDTVAKLSNSNAVSADYRAKIKEIMDSYELAGHTKATIEKLKATQEYINRQALAGENVEIPQRIIDKLKILERTPKAQLTLNQIQGLQAEVELLGKLGETKWSSKQALYEGERELRKAELLKSATSINSKQVKSIGLEKDPAKYIQVFTQARNYLQKTRVGLTPIEGLADITGMQPMKRVMDMNFGNYLTYNDEKYKQWYELTKDFTEENFKKIGAYAVSQQSGGVERLANSGITQAQIDALKLTTEEMKAYEFVRTTFDNEFPAVRKYALDVYNKDVGEVKNYVSFMSDNDAMNELELFDRFGTPPDFPTQTKTVEQGFTKERAKMADTKLELNIDKIFRRHTDDVAYMLTMGRDVKQYFEIVNSPEMRAKLGDVGSIAWLQYLDLMARKGGSEGAKRIAILDTLRGNLSAGVLAFRLSSAVIQLTSFTDAMGTIGAEWAMKGASSIATSKEWRAFVMDNFPEVKKAVGDDLAFREFGDNFLQRATRAGFAPLQALDGLMRSMTVAGGYQKLALEKGIAVDLANPNKELIQEATKLMRFSQGSSFFKDQPLSLTTNFGLMDNKSLNKTLLTFQSFMLARWDNLQRQIWRLGIKEKNYKKASMSFLFMVIVATAMEEGLRRGVKTVTNEATEFITGKEGQPVEGSFIGNSAMNLVQAVPIAGQLASSITYSSNPVPIINTFEQSLSGASSVWNGKELRTKIRGGLTLAGSTGSILGVPGSGQASQIAKDFIPPVNAKEPKTKEEKQYAEIQEKKKEARDEAKEKVMPAYTKVKELLNQGNEDGAREIVNSLSDEDYEAYKAIRTAERTKSTNTFKTYLNTNPAKAVKYIREQNPTEQRRLIDNLSDEEYEMYKKGKTMPLEEDKPSLLKKGVNALFGVKKAEASAVPKDYVPPKPKAETIGLISVPEKWNYAMEDVYMRYPDVPKGMVETVLLMESSMGKDASLKKKDFGEFGWLGGHTKTGAFQDLLNKAQKDQKLEKKIKLFEKKGNKYAIENIKNLGDEYSAIQATGSVLAKLKRENPNMDVVDLYFDKYVTADVSDTPARREKFKKALAYYSL